MTQMPLAVHDHMSQTLASDRADQSFRIPVLPRRSRRCRSVANAHRANAARKCLAVDTVAITNEVVRHRFPPAGLADLPGYSCVARCTASGGKPAAPSMPFCRFASANAKAVANDQHADY